MLTLNYIPQATTSDTDDSLADGLKGLEKIKENRKGMKDKKKMSNEQCHKLDKTDKNKSLKQDDQTMNLEKENANVPLDKNINDGLCKF